MATLTPPHISCCSSEPIRASVDPEAAALAPATHRGGRRGRRRARRTGRVLGRGFIAAIGLTVLLGSAPAQATVTTPVMYAMASSSTSVGRTVFDHTNLSGTVTPTGTITFKLYAPGDTGCQSPVFTQTVAVSGTGSDDSSRYTTTMAGTYGWIATYNGDANNSAFASRCGDPGQSVIVEKLSPVVSLATAFSAGAMHATAALQYGFAPVTGTMTFTVTGPNDQFCSGTPVYTQTMAVNGAGSYDSGRYLPTAPGTYTYRIRYSGDSNNYGVGPTACLDPGASVTVTQDQLGAARAAFTYPANGAVKDTSKPFSWTAAGGTQRYSLWVGTSSGGTDVAAAYLPATTQSYDVSMLPVGKTLYARLWVLSADGVWSIQQDITFAAGDGAAFTSPGNGESGVAAGPMTWSAVSQAQYYAVWVGTTPGGSDLASVALPSATTSYDMSLPVGHQVYARVWTMVNGVWARYHDISFTPGQGATFTNPADRQTGVDATRPLSWTGAAGAQYYAVWVGTTPGGADVTAVAVTGSTTSYTVPGLPSGRTLYARVWTMVGGHWGRYQEVSFTTA